MTASYTYRLIKGTAWGIMITLRGEILPGVSPPPGAFHITEDVWLQVDVGWRPLEDELGFLKLGVRLVAREIKRTRVGPPILVRLTGLRYNPTDFQPEGLAAAVTEWAAEVCGFPNPHLPSAFDRPRRRYVFAFPSTLEANAAETPITITAPPNARAEEFVRAVLRRYWPDSFLSLKSGKAGFLNDPHTSTYIWAGDDFFIHRGLGTQVRTKNDGIVLPENRVLHFHIKPAPAGGTGPQQVMFFCEALTEEVKRLVRALESTLGANEIAPQEPSQAA